MFIAALLKTLNPNEYINLALKILIEITLFIKFRNKTLKHILHYHIKYIF